MPDCFDVLSTEAAECIGSIGFAFAGRVIAKVRKGGDELCKEVYCLPGVIDYFDGFFVV